jgi:hypothetical protein
MRGVLLWRRSVIKDRVRKRRRFYGRLYFLVYVVFNGTLLMLLMLQTHSFQTVSGRKS